MGELLNAINVDTKAIKSTVSNTVEKEKLEETHTIDLPSLEKEEEFFVSRSYHHIFSRQGDKVRFGLLDPLNKTQVTCDFPLDKLDFRTSNVIYRHLEQELSKAALPPRYRG